MRTMLLAALLFTIAAAQGADRKYAILSLVGDRLTIVDHQSTTGTSRDANQRQHVDLATAALDNAALLAIDTVVRQARPDATTVLLAVRAPAALRAQEKSLETGAGPGEIIQALAPALSGSGATHLVLLTKARGPAAFELRGTHTGSGSLEGLGFYIDRTLPIDDPDTFEQYVGFLAPFAYFRVSVVDLASSSVLREGHAFSSQVKGNTESLHPWDAMKPQEKIDALQALLRRELARVVPPLLS